MSEATATLKARITEDMKSCMRSGDKQRLGTIRLILAAIKQREVDERIELDDTQVLVTLDKMLKQRRESISQYQNANRQDLVDQEAFEAGIIQGYMPEQLGDAEVDVLIQEAMTATGATTIKDMGKVMGQLKAKLQGRADMGAVGAKIKARLGG